MLSKILFPTDFSETANKVKKELLKISNCNIKELILLHVVESKLIARSPITHQIIINDMYVEEKAVDSAYKKLEKLKAEFESSGIKTKLDVVKGHPFEEILVYAEKEKATSIILGEKGLNEVDRLLIGSTAEKVVRKAGIPVIVIK